MTLYHLFMSWLIFNEIVLLWRSFRLKDIPHDD